MTHIHTWMKKENSPPPLQTHSAIYPVVNLQSTSHTAFSFFPHLSSFYCTTSHFIQSQGKKWCCFTLAVVVFFSHEYIFWVKCFQFLLVIFSYLIQGGNWNTQALLSRIVSLTLSLATVIECGFPSLAVPHIQTYALHFHIYTHNKKRHTSDRSSSISVCLDTSGPLPPAQTPPSSHTLQSGDTHWDRTSKRMSFRAFSFKSCTSILSLLVSFAQKGTVIK